MTLKPLRCPPGVDAASWAVYESFRRAMLLHRQLILKLLAEKGGHPGQAGVLWLLVENDGASQAELADALNLSRPSVTTMLQKMERAGLVERRPDEHDQRVVRTYLTQAGREHLRVLKDVYLRLVESTLGPTDEEDRHQLARLLTQYADNIAAALKTAPQGCTEDMDDRMVETDETEREGIAGC